ncbi:uncharacterized protein LOC124438035 [Xenia sp. Carnegie-2017]|uniref:uncharacterized protein LOC124438035 n=1 Tax=Xenia sp. Carnegie-2017 TaxID=2897299 RepID=UPI001F046848|nr:uncharacterized protein LOC124438035 [Xenia sp. Carnegie-2017]
MKETSQSSQERAILKASFVKNEVLFIMQSKKRKLNFSEECLYYCMKCVEQSTENIMGYDIDFDFRTALPIDANFLEKAQKVCMVCEHFQIINPGLFDHLQEKLKMPLQTKRSVCHALSCLKTGLFRDGITWAKVIAFYAFISALVVECITKGNCQYIVNIIYAVKQFIDGELVPWIKENEGWDHMLYQFRSLDITKRDKDFDHDGLMKKTSTFVGQNVLKMARSFSDALVTGICVLFKNIDDSQELPESTYF